MGIFLRIMSHQKQFMEVIKPYHKSRKIHILDNIGNPICKNRTKINRVNYFECNLNSEIFLDSQNSTYQKICKNCREIELMNY
jgi:hypothetical protein